MKIALILTICGAFSGLGNDECVQPVVKLYDDIDTCTKVMDENRQTLDDRYLSCGWADESLLIDRSAGRSVEEIIADLNRQFSKSTGDK